MAFVVSAGIVSGTTALAAGSLAVGAVGVGMNAAGAAASGKAAALQAKANANADLFNAQIAEQNAKSLQSQALADNETLKRQAKSTIGTQVANFGASGIATGSGSALDILAESARLASLDSLTLQYNTAIKVRDQNNQAELDRQAAKNGMAAGSIASTAGALGAVGSAASGLASIGFNLASISGNSNSSNSSNTTTGKTK